MGRRAITACAAALAVVAFVASPRASARQHRHHARQTGTGTVAPLSPSAMEALRIQVGLDRAGFSPGEIDAAMGSNTQRALDAFTRHGGNRSTLPADAVATYRITDQDAAGPFTPDIPDDLIAQAKLPALGYHDVLELLGEKFHCNPALLRLMNRRAQFAAGEEILAPNVAGTIQPVAPPRPEHSRARRGRASSPPQRTTSDNPAETTVTVSRSQSTLTLTDDAGHLLMFAPVTTGSEHDPLPIGEWKVTGIYHDPEFHYNPDLFWNADAKDSKATIAAGPNNPVGVVWIDINRPHYGLHGTPEPSRIGKTTSHGCVRLTNWDAAKLASLVHNGTRVLFTE